ncbi:winged helix-turn-helix domain-containing protein [Pseudoalteromonas sp. MMG021]|nr:winged helix-turn-helix domain-containing protein [Pseudoalteromonas sp. MMG022]
MSLFLENPAKLLSKEDILSHVWPRKVLSDQVVFQTISQLRAVLGDDAIKTFPKRGYQWQLAFSDVPPSQNTASDHVNSSVVKHKMVYILSALAIIFVSGVSLWMSNQEKQKVVVDKPAQQLANWFVIPFATRSQALPQQALKDLNHQLTQRMQQIQRPDTHSDSALEGAWRFFASPFMTRETQIIKSNVDGVLLSGVIYSYQLVNQQSPHHILEYLAQGRYRQWRGYLHMHSLPQLDEALYQSLAPIMSSDFFNEPSQSAATAELATLVARYPEHLALLQQLIELQIEQTEYDIADAQIEKLAALAKAQSQPVYIAYAHWLRGKLLLELEQHQLAMQHFEQAQSHLAQINLLALQSEVSQSQIDVAGVSTDFAQIQTYLFQAASQARLANRPAQEIRAYTLLSIKAAKLKLYKERYDFLKQAELLIEDYQLDDSHKMLTDYHRALFAKEKEQKLRYYHRVLSRPVTPENFWVFFSVTEQLVDYALAERAWSAAEALSQRIDEPTRRSYLMAKLSVAKGEPELAIQHATTAFNLARTQGIDWVGLEMALMLLELLQSDSGSAQVTLSKRYISNTAKSWWLTRHQQRLEQVGVEANSY